MVFIATFTLTIKITGGFTMPYLQFIKKLAKYRLEFKTFWDEEQSEYKINIILSNHEYAIGENDCELMDSVWSQIQWQTGIMEA